METTEAEGGSLLKEKGITIVSRHAGGQVRTENWASKTGSRPFMSDTGTHAHGWNDGDEGQIHDTGLKGTPVEPCLWVAG